MSKSSQSSAAASTLRVVRTDRFLQIFGYVALVLLILYLLPQIDRHQLVFFTGDYPQYIFLFAALLACFIRLRNLPRDSERPFWTCLSAALVSWGAVLGLYVLAPDLVRTLAGDIGSDLLFTLFYLFLIVSTELAPTRVDPTSKACSGRRLRIAAAVGFVLLTFCYFVVLPAILNYEIYETWVPSLYMFVVLDLYLTWRFVHLLRSTGSRRYRWIYGLLAASMASWAVTDTLEGLTFLGRLELERGTSADLLWSLAFVWIVLSARAHALVPETGAPHREATDTACNTLRVIGPLILMAVLLPAMHTTFYGANLLDPITRRARDLLVLGHLLGFGLLVLTQQYFLEQANQRLREHLELANDRLQETMRLEAVGNLAGGIAHDFNNLLTSVQGYAELALKETPEGEAFEEHLGCIQQSATRATDLVRQLLALSRQQVLHPEVVDLNRLIRSSEERLRRRLGEQIGLEMDLDPDLGRVRVDPAQMERILVNLALNAREAMPTGGDFFFETANVWLDESAVTDEGVESGSYVALRVRDTGKGMDDDTQLRAFEPFFTTKEVGAGPGLGLSVIHGIVRQSDGWISLSSTSGEGTTVEIFLPRVLEHLQPGAGQP